MAATFPSDITYFPFAVVSVVVSSRAEIAFVAASVLSQTSASIDFEHNRSEGASPLNDDRDNTRSL